MVIIVFGVTGCGKTTVGKLLAKDLGLPFYDADGFHPEENVSKMALGIPLTDEDRLPWLENLGRHIQQWDQEGGAILACSALNEEYRSILQTVPGIGWVLLDGPVELIRQRLGVRKGHFMNPKLLNSQIQTFEQPDYGWTVSVDQDPRSIVDEIKLKLKLS